ncbi:hypothetical protein E2C01_081960 [Portunus trituberculatus]|uniref:Secreted protein n=1 Tax=Portunus trituberculatus TaxID=210409 RepID=A0A5B7IXV4_PORTR|nr:hypothetical protein [Portunus trituberculatus]
MLNTDNKLFLLLIFFLDQTITTVSTYRLSECQQLSELLSGPKSFQVYKQPFSHVASHRPDPRRQDVKHCDTIKMQFCH